MSSARGSDAAIQPSTVANRWQLPPQLVLPRRHSPMRAARSPSRATVSKPSNGRASRSRPSTGARVVPSGSSGVPVNAMAPLAAQRSTRGSCMPQGNVWTSSNS